MKQLQRTPLQAPHSSWAQHVKKGVRIRPKNMSSMKMDYELSAGLTDIALDIFTDAANANMNFQACLLSVYMSGLEHGYQTTKELGTSDADL